MNEKTKGEKLFIVLSLSVVCVLFFCLAGCSGSCFGCSIGCEKNEGGCASGVAHESEGCGSDDSCISSFNCVDFEEPYDDGSGEVLLLSCETVEDGCGGKSGCYNGLFCGGCNACGTCGIFFGENDGDDVEETMIGCMDGGFACGDTEGIWAYLLNSLYDVLGLK